jgi:hypothetical protein
MSACLKKEALLALADRELPFGEMEVAKRHIAVCSECEQELDSIRATSLKVNLLLSSLALREEPINAPVAVARIPSIGETARIQWATVATVGILVAALLLVVMMRRPHSGPDPRMVKSAVPAPTLPIEKKEVLVAAVAKPALVGTRKTSVKVREFQALDDGEPIETGMIYRVSLPATTSPNGSAPQAAKRIPAEVIVDEFGKVRAIRFLQ